MDVGVGIGDLSEEELGVANVAGVGEGAEGEDAARGEAVGDEACAGHVGLDLAELSHGGAGLHEGEDGVGDAEIGVGVPFGLRAKGGRGRGRGEADNRWERRPPHLAGGGREWGVWRANFIIAVELYSVRAGDHKWRRGGYKGVDFSAVFCKYNPGIFQIVNSPFLYFLFVCHIF